MTRNLLVKLFVVLIICSLIKSQDPDQAPVQTVLELNKLLNLTNMESGYTYYSVNFELNQSSEKLFLITVQTQQSQTIQIFTSIYYEGIKEYYKYPSYQNNTNGCSYSSMDTCAVGLPSLKQGERKNITVYIGVELFFTDQMSILTTLEDIYPFKIGINYDIDFALWESAVFTLSAEEVNQYEQLVIQMQYDAYKDMGKFAMYAGVDQIPHGYKNRIQSKYMGAFTQILILEPLKDNQTYYILLEGEQGSEFDVLIKPFSTSAPKLEMNDTLYYYSPGTGQKDHDEINFSIAINYAAEDQTLPLLVDLAALGGYGQFAIDYCEGFTNFTFQNFNGESGQVIIPTQERQQCFEMIKNQGGLMIQNLIVSIRNVPWYFSFCIGVFQGQYPLIISPYSQKMGMLIDSEYSRVYDIEGYINQSFVLKFKTVTGEMELNFVLRECRVGFLGVESCKAIMNSSDAISDPNTPEYKQFNWTCKQRKSYKLQITHGSQQKFDSQYVLLLLPLNPHPSLLTPSRPVYSIIQKNQYQYYVINLTLIQKQTNITIDNSTNILITMVEKNGACMMLTSLTEKQPLFQQVFEMNSTVDYSWNGKRQYNVGKETDAIFVGIKGEKESLYHLQVTISANEQVPQSYTKLVSDKILSFNLSQQLHQDHLLLSYTAHSIPYTIIISPSPSCMVYSYSLPFTNTSCRQLPSEITQKTIYLKIFRKTSEQKDDGDFKFVVYVYSGSHYLFEYTPIMIACEEACYEFVTVFVEKQPIKIVHKGMGYVAHKDSSLVYSNEKMEIDCEKGYPCFVTINASLPWGGNMELFYDSIDAQQIQWMNKPLTFNSPLEPKLFYMQIRSWNSLNTAIFYTEGLTVTVYYNIYSMRENATNALEYGFPNSVNYMRKSRGNPLRRFHIVEFDQKIIQQLGCKDQNDLCIATLAVYANTLGDYSVEYINKSIGYYSCNTYEYYIPMNSPYQLSEEYSLIYFSHQLNEDQKSNLAPCYYVRVQPLSSCRPQIFAPFSQNSQNASFSQDMPFYGLYKIDSRSLDKEDPEIEFSVSTDTPCEFTLWVLDSDVQAVVENKNYEFTTDSNGVVTFVYSDKYLWTNKKFSVGFDQQVNEILIGKYETYPNGSVKIPTLNTSLASAIQSKHLSYNSQQPLSTLYIIKASTNANTKLNIKISTFQGFTTIMTNEKEKFTFSQDNTQVIYRYFSNSDFMMFVTADMGMVKVTVTDYKRDDDRTVVDQMIDENSQPWIMVNAQKNDIREYVITFENVLLMNSNQRNLQTDARNLQTDARYPRVTLHIEQIGTVGLPQLFDGVALFDAFYTDDAQNCYKYISEAIVGRPSLSVDLIFGSEMINKIGEIHSSLIIESSNSRVNFTSKKLPTGYRIETSYSSDQVYSICFSINQQQQLVGSQFYVMVENLEYSLKHLTLDVPLSQINPGSYQIYQYVATENQYLMIEVVNCFGKPTLLGTQNYQDIYLGQVSQLGSFYRNNTLSVASKFIPMGYFYFAIKQDADTDRYKIRVQLMKENQTLYDKFQLKQKTISKAKSIQENGRQKVRVNLPPISMINLPNQVKVHHITYNLLVDNLKQEQEYSSNIIAKCPVLGNRNLSSYKFVQNLTQSFKLSNLTQDDIRIDIPTAQLPQNFNLTGYIEVSISQPYTQTLTFYYESSTFKLKNTYISSSHGVSAFTIVFIVMLIIGTLIVVYIMYRRWKAKQKDSRVAFEMANYNYENTQGQSNLPQKETEKSVANDSTPSRSLKKALNQNVGYGEFVDESL